MSVAPLALVFACALWGLSFPLIKVLHLEQTPRVPGATSEFLASWVQVARFSLGALLLAPVVARLPRPTALEIRQGVLVGVWGGAGMWLQADGLAHTEASTSAFLTQAYCVILPLWVVVRDRRLPPFKVFGATAMVVVGCAVLAGIRSGDFSAGRGEIETLGAAVFFAFQILTLESPRYSANRGRPVTFVMCAAIAVIFLPLVFVTAPEGVPVARSVAAAGGSWQCWVFVVLLALFSTVGAFLLMNTWQRRVSATEAGLIYTSEPVFASALALVLPAWLSGLAGVDYANESLTATLLVGGALILAANIWMQWRRPPHPPTVAPAPGSSKVG